MESVVVEAIDSSLSSSASPNETRLVDGRGAGVLRIGDLQKLPVLPEVEGGVKGATVTGDTVRVEECATVVVAFCVVVDASKGVTTELNDIFLTALGETGGWQGEAVAGRGPGLVDDCRRL